MSGWKGLRSVWPAAVACGVAFAGTQFVVSNFIGPQLTDILSSLAAMGAALLMLPKRQRKASAHSGHDIFLAWAPYALLVIFVLLWGYKPLQARLDAFTIPIHWPGLADKPPYRFTWLGASCTACLFAAILGAIVTGLSLRQFGNVLVHTAKQLALAELTLAAVLGLAFTM